MLLPNKIVPFEESIVSRFPIVLSALEHKDMAIVSLYNAVKTKIYDVGDFLEILDCLYVLDKVEYNEEQEVLHFVNRSEMQ